ncbi:MAG: 30S ribosomal protein S11 [Candidatus Peribacteraceae bacterium]
MLESSPTATVATEEKESTGKKPRGKKIKRSVPHARVCITASENNTIVTITDGAGNALAWASSGSAGFKGSRKSTPYAAKVAAEKAMGLCAQFGIQTLSIEVKGIGPGREQAIRGLQVSGVTFTSITDTTPIAHGGCKPKKPRRV